MAYLCGRWKWNAIVWCSTSIKNNKDYPINFTNGGVDRKRLGFRIDLNGSNHTIGYIKDKQTSYMALFHDHSSLLEAAYFTLNGNFPNEMDFGKVPQKIDDEFYEFFVANATNCDTIADKLQYIAENEQRVYDKGYQEGNDAGYDEGLEVGYEDGFGKGKQEGHSEGYQDGLVSGEGYSKAESDFWDAVQESGKRTEYAYAFSRWASEYIRPKHKVVLTVAGSQKNIFYMNKYVKKIESAYFDFSQLPRGSNDNQAFSYCFTSSTALEEIEDIGLPISYSYAYAFAWCSKLKKVAMIRVDASTQGMGNAFTSCIALESVAFEGEIGISLDLRWSTKLNLASMQNIVACLAEGVSGKTLTLSKTAVNAIEGVSGSDFVTPSTGTDTVEWINIRSEAQRKGWDIVLA